MKICSSCGAVQSDERTTCVDCGAFLGDEVPPGFEKAVEKDISKTISKLNDRSDPLGVSVVDRIIGVLSIVLAAVMIASAVYATVALARLEELAKSFEQTPEVGESAVAYYDGSAVFIYIGAEKAPEQRLEQARTAAVLSALILLAAAAEALLPGLFWGIYRFRVSIRADGEISPGGWYKATRKAACWIFFAIGCTAAAEAIIRLI